MYDLINPLHRLTRDKIDSYKVLDFIQPEVNPTGLSNVFVCCTCCNIMVRYVSTLRTIRLRYSMCILHPNKHLEAHTYHDICPRYEVSLLCDGPATVLLQV